jgi:homogentisate 1,2-dioxygenase
LERNKFTFSQVAPTEIVVIPRGIKFQINAANSGPARGYICECFSGHFRLPDLGPIGANGLANVQDFKYPVADYEDSRETHVMLQKFLGKLFSAAVPHSPFDVVAWSGNYLPFKYSLKQFCAVNSVTFDHLDPSIFTVLTIPTSEPGVAALDFVVFPPRWAVQESTFRPPYYHKNCMSEFMGNIAGAYDAKPTGFSPGSASLHSIMVGHGPDANTYKAASDSKNAHFQGPVKMPEGSWSFMFETTYFLRLTQFAKEFQTDDKYHECWAGLPREFDPTRP